MEQKIRRIIYKILYNTIYWGGMLVFIMYLDGAFGFGWGILGGILWYSLFPAAINLIIHWKTIKPLYLHAVWLGVGVLEKWGWIKKKSKGK